MTRRNCVSCLTRPFGRVFGVLFPLVFTVRLTAAEVPAAEAVPAAFRQALRPGEPFPLAPGWRWTYQRDGKKGKEALVVETLPERKVAGVATACLWATGDSFLWAPNALVAVKGGELLNYGWLHEDPYAPEPERVRLFKESPPLVLLPSEFREESFWESGTSLKFTATILRQEPVEVAAGRFTAWRIDYTLNEHLGTEFDLRTWFVPGLGFVKIMKWRESVGGAVGEKHPLREPIVYELARIERSAEAHSLQFPSKPLPVENLPAGVQAPQGEVTLFADYQDRWWGGVVVYLVNRSPKPVEIVLQGGVSPDLRLETKTAGERWRRARPQYGWCGTGTRPLRIEPGKFVLLLGAEPERGEVGDIRFRLSEPGLVSNAGRGLVDAEEVRRARYDPLSMEEADLDLVREVLFDGLPLSREEAVEVQGQAIDRIRKLPWPESLPLLDRVLATDALLELHFRRIADTFAFMAPERFETWAGKIVTGGPSRLRSLLLSSSDVLLKGYDAEVRAILLRQLEDPKTPDLRHVMDQLARVRVPEAKDLLARIAGNGGYPEESRIAAEYLRAEWFGTHLVELRAEVVYPPVVEAAAAIPVVATIKNTCERPLDFSYARPSEIIGIYLEREDGRFLKPKPGVVWFRRTGASGATSVKLLPGASHEVRMNLLDCFELPADLGPEPQSWSLRVWVGCSLPGIHEIPQVGGCSQMYGEG